MAAVRYYDPMNREIVGPQPIWADRLAIAFWLILGGLGGLVYAAWGVPGAFVLFEQIIGCFTAAAWFGLRVLDWLATGRIR
jgi:hypothetical protein